MFISIYRLASDSSRLAFLFWVIQPFIYTETTHGLVLETLGSMSRLAKLRVLLLQPLPSNPEGTLIVLSHASYKPNEITVNTLQSRSAVIPSPLTLGSVVVICITTQVIWRRYRGI